jgi:AcrR family transcriptional regulator
MKQDELYTPSASSDDTPVREPLYARLKPGRGHTEEEVFTSQWTRLRRAMIELSAERGYEAITVRDLTSLAGVSTRSFYRHFRNAEECFTYTYESLMHDGLRRAHGVQRGNGTWEQALRASLRSLLEDLAADPKVAQLLLVEAFALGPGMQIRMREAVVSFERLLNDSLAGDPRAPTLSRHMLCGIAAGVTRVVRRRLLEGGSVDLDALNAELEDWVLSLLHGCTAVQEPPASNSAAFTSKLQSGEISVPVVFAGVEDETKRIFAAAIELASTGGFESLTFSRIRKVSRVSRRSLDALFLDVGECFLAAIEAIMTAAATRAQRVILRANDFEAGTHAAVRALCADVARNPSLARLAFLEIFSPGRAGFLSRERLISRGVNWLRNTAPADRQPSELHAEASIAAAWRIVHTEIAAGGVENLPRLAPRISYALLPSAFIPVQPTQHRLWRKTRSENRKF